VRIEPGGGLVEDDHLRVVDERLRQCHPLPIALGQFADELAVHRPQTAVFNDPGFPLPPPAAVQATRPSDKVEIGPHLHVRVERQNFRQVADELAHFVRLVADVFAAHRGVAKGRVEIRREEFHGGRFAGAIRTEQADYFPTLDVKRGFV
jgi:hypothetical protein